jgi:hypothetical protein
MTLRAAAAAAVAVALLGAASCGYPTFEFASSGTGGRSTTSASAAQSSSGSAGGSVASSSQSGAGGGATTGAATSGVGGGGPSCPVDHVLISEVRSRGLGGGNDEFIELYNPTDSVIPMDDAWSIMVRGSTALKYFTRWQGTAGSNLSIPAHGHFLLAGPSYAQSPAPDVMISSSITSDSASILLINIGSTIDAVCFASMNELATVSTFMCEGNPASNAPHDDSVNGMSNFDSSVARKQNGCADGGDNATDFAVSHPAKPESTQSPLVP